MWHGMVRPAFVNVWHSGSHRNNQLRFPNTSHNCGKGPQHNIPFPVILKDKGPFCSRNRRAKCRATAMLREKLTTSALHNPTQIKARGNCFAHVTSHVLNTTQKTAKALLAAWISIVAFGVPQPKRHPWLLCREKRCQSKRGLPGVTEKCSRRWHQLRPQTAKETVNIASHSVMKQDEGRTARSEGKEPMIGRYKGKSIISWILWHQNGGARREAEN